MAFLANNGIPTWRMICSPFAARVYFQHGVGTLDHLRSVGVTYSARHMTRVAALLLLRGFRVCSFWLVAAFQIFAHQRVPVLAALLRVVCSLVVWISLAFRCALFPRTLRTTRAIQFSSGLRLP